MPVNQPLSARCACDDVQWTAFSAFSGLVRPAAARTVQPTCPQAHYCAGKDFVWGRKMCYKSRNVHFSVPVDRVTVNDGVPYTNGVVTNHAMRKGQVH